MTPSARLHSTPSAARIVDEPLQVLADARADERERAAYEAGLAAGQAAAVRSSAAALDAALAALEGQVEQAQAELARHAIELGVEVARALVRTRIEAGDYDLERVVRGALSDAGVGRGRVTVHLHPDDHARLEGIAFRGETHLEADPALPAGDVHLSTPRGLLVRDVEGALESIREQLLEDLS